MLIFFIVNYLLFTINNSINLRKNDSLLYHDNNKRLKTAR